MPEHPENPRAADGIAHADARVKADRQPRVAVVGAGVSGLSCASVLHDHGYSVEVFDRGRRAGGRLASRVADLASIDHGAQYFTVRDPEFGLAVENWQQERVVARWNANIVIWDGRESRAPRGSAVRYVGVPTMNALAGHLAAGLHVRQEQRVQEVTRMAQGWGLGFSSGESAGPFDAVVVAAPPAQAVELLEHSTSLSRLLRTVQMDPCWAAWLIFEEPIDVPFDGAFVEHGPLSWMARNSSKPGRTGAEAWVLHASADWSRTRLTHDRREIQQALTQAFEELLVTPLPRIRDSGGHRWGLATPNPPLPQRAVFDPELGIGACGDWCGGPRVEGAYLSGRAMADRVISWLPGDPPVAKT